MKKIFFTLYLIFPSLILYPQDTLNVPLNYPTIQTAINAATNGDIVLVEEGTYMENINFQGKAITVASRFLVDDSLSHINNTIIDGSQPTHPDSGSVVKFITGEDTTSVLCGFTITGGSGTFVPANPPNPPYNLRIGGGICINSNVGARIINNIIEQNIISTNDFAAGGGIYSEGPGGNGFSIIEDNIIRNNIADGNTDVSMGGGIFMGGSGRIVRNTIDGNTCSSTNSNISTVGGGVRFWAFVGQDTTFCLLEDNIISNNKSVSAAGSAYGGGINTNGCTITMRRNIVTKNIVQSNILSVGAGLHVGGVGYLENILECNLFSQNNYIGSGSCYGGGLHIYYSNPIVANNIFYSNEATFGGGINVNDNAHPEFRNNVILSNTATSGGGGISSFQSTLIVMNSIIWDNSAPSSPQIFMSGGTYNVTYSDIEGGWTGTGNINLDPELMDTVLASGDTLFAILSINSPCIDTGNPDPNYNDPPDPNNPGYALFPSRGTIVNDMGAYGGPRAIVWPIVADINEEFQYINEIPRAFQLSQNYPNPFNPSTKIQYLINSKQKVTLKVYDLLGREIATLVNEEKPAGTYEIIWKAESIPSGVYFYQLRTGSFVETNKMILLK
jgi:hypothetical protein